MAPTPPTRNSTSRFLLAHLATGIYTMLIGLVYLLPFLLNVRAQESDDFLPNLFLGPPLALIGSSWTLAQLSGVGGPRWLSRTLALVNPVVMVLGSWLVSLPGGDGIRSFVFILLDDAGLLFGVFLFLATRSQQGHIAGKAMLLASVGAGLVFVVSILLGSRSSAFVESVSGVPSNVDLPILGLSLLLGLGIFWLGWLWNTSEHADTPIA